MTPDEESAWPALPVETEIYILPNGDIVVADLPAELAAQIAQLTQREITASITNADYVADQQHPTQPDQRG